MLLRVAGALIVAPCFVVLVDTVSCLGSERNTAVEAERYAVSDELAAASVGERRAISERWRR